MIIKVRGDQKHDDGIEVKNNNERDMKIEIEVRIKIRTESK